MKAKVSIGMVGLERMGQIFAGHLAGHGQVRIACVSDVVQERAAQIAEKFGLESYSVYNGGAANSRQQHS
jgi:predicted dehydrogenase